MHRASLWTGLALLLATAFACGPRPPTPTPKPEPSPAPSASPKATGPVVRTTLERVGLDPTALDRRANPCQDFYEFACGGWLAKTEIPADKPAWSRSFNEIAQRNEEDLRSILETAAKSATDDDARKIGQYYGVCMNEQVIEADGLRGIDPLLRLARAAADKKSLAAAITELHKHQIWAVFDISDEQDFKDARRVIATLDQNGLGLPDRDYYVKDDEKSKQLRETYVAHVERMLKLGGMTPKQAKQGADDVMHVETELAKISKTRVERRDPKSIYNKLDRAALAKLAPNFPWDDYFKALGLTDVKDLNVTSTAFFEGMSRLEESVKPAAWKNYLVWHVLHATAPALGKAFVDESFKLTAALTGQKELRARWRRCVDATDDALGELLAKPFVKLRFGGDSKEATERYVGEISNAFAHEIERLDWMDGPTKARALEKLHKMAYLIGYPKKWRSYDFPIDAKSYSKNALVSHAFDLKYKLARIGKPVDREEFAMTPPTVNAYYNPLKNHMVFPAGILQPPFFNREAAVAVNLGAIGLVVGHELTHGFDDEGAQFNADGNMSSWWPEIVATHFKDKTQCIATQYGHYEALPGMKLNGELTLGENIADGGGAKLAFHAYRALRASAPERLVADGFTEDQLFFLGVGQAWCSKQRDEFARMRVTVDPHSPARYRVNGPLANMSEFAEAFACQKGTPMNPPNRCEVW